MAQGDPGKLFFNTFTDEVCEPLVDAMRAAYDSASESDHSLEGKGSCEQLFGTTVYYCGKQELLTLVHTSRGAIRLHSEHPMFRLDIGDYVIGFYRVGRTADEDINHCFPKNKNGGAKQLAELEEAGQTRFQFPDPETGPGDLSSRRNLVLAHLGNKEEGLTAIYLAIPVRHEKGRIAEWGFTHQLWRQEMPASIPKTSPTAEIVPIEPEREPVVPPKVKEEQNDQ